MAGPYTLGATVTLEGDFTDPDTGILLDAADITCTVKLPTGGSPVDVAPVTRLSQGIYRALFTSAGEGEHWYRFESATLRAAREGAFVVAPQKVI